MDPSRLSDWQPGSPLQISSPRLILRTLTLSDVSADAARWYGSKERLRHVFDSSLKLEDYLRGLIGACDQKRFFAFTIALGPPQSEGRPLSSLIVGHAKMQVHESDGERLATTTIVIGDESMPGQGLGMEARGALAGFAFEALGVSAMAPNIYADHTRLVARTLRDGYREVRRATERRPGREPREVVLFRLDRKAWQESVLPLPITYGEMRPVEPNGT